MDSLTQLAADGYASGVSTFVIQLGSDFDLNPVAKAGSGGPIYLISNGDVTQDLDLILKNIVTPHMGAQWQIPATPDPAHPIDPLQTVVQLLYQNGASWVSGLVPHLNSASDCSTSVYGGWYLDSSQGPMEMCPCTAALNLSEIQAEFYCL